MNKNNQIQIRFLNFLKISTLEKTKTVQFSLLGASIEIELLLSERFQRVKTCGNWSKRGQTFFHFPQLPSHWFGTGSGSLHEKKAVFIFDGRRAAGKVMQNWLNQKKTIFVASSFHSDENFGMASIVGKCLIFLHKARVLVCNLI